jgi:cardiolipin synthase A/B
MNSHWLPGNRLSLLENGEAFYPRVFEAIAAAEKEVLLETFILFDDEVGRGLQQALLSAAVRGAAVHVMIDGWGSPDLPPTFTGPLLEAGVQLRSYEPAQKLLGTRVNLLRRMHRKLVVVDGGVAFVGGINYTVDQLVESGPQGMQDYAVEVQGPLVGQIHAFCRASLDEPQPPRFRWLRRWRAGRNAGRSAGDGRGGNDARGVGRDGTDEPLAAFVTRDNHRNRTDIERHYRLAIRGARQRVLIANAYFFPGYRLLRELRRAAQRGVQVDLVLSARPDVPWVQHASELLYVYLLRAGVCVHEYHERPLHAKVAVVDDHWATIGSSNLDPTSLGLNLEANVVMRDKAFAVALRERIERLMQQRCNRVQKQSMTPLRSAWVALRSFVLFHALRRFPVWIRMFPSSAPRVEPLRQDAT